MRTRGAGVLMAATAMMAAMSWAAADQLFEGRLQEGDQVLATDGTFYRVHEFEAREGDELVIDLMSNDFDAFLILHSPSGEIFRDDDGGEGMNSRLSITADATGQWRAFANTFGRGETGSYQLRVRKLDLSQMETRRFTGSLDDNSQRIPTNNAFYNEHSIELQAGQEITVDLMSSDFDAMLHVHSPSGQVHTDDDGGAGTDSRLSLVADQAGTWRMVATSYRAGERGAYNLNVRLSAPGEFEVRGFDGNLTDASQRLPTNNAFFNEHTMELEAGQEMVIDLMSDAFDALLHVHSPSGQVYTDDDGGQGTNSRLSITADRAGTWRFVSTSYRAGEQGAYRLNVRVRQR